METLNHSAGLETNNVVMSYGKEAQWGVKPEVPFKQIRMEGETFSSTKTRNRPKEINKSGQASKAITTKVEGSGGISGGLSAATYDDFLAASIGAEFGDVVALTASTISATAGGFADSNSGFETAGFVAGQWVRVAGYNSEVDGIYHILSVVPGAITTMPAPPATAVAGPSVTVSGCMVRNGREVHTFYMQKELDTDKFLCYPGTFYTGGTISVALGDYAKINLDALVKDQLKEVTDQSTGPQIEAPDGDVISTVHGIGAIYRGAAPVNGTITKVDLKWTKEGVRSQYGIGSAAAAGVGNGTLGVSGSIDMYFGSWELYDEFVAETGGMLAVPMYDESGDGYVFSVCNAKLMNPKITAGGPDSDVMATFEVEGNPSAKTGVFGGRTIQIDKI